MGRDQQWGDTQRSANKQPFVASKVNILAQTWGKFAAVTVTSMVDILKSLELFEVSSCGNRIGYLAGKSVLCSQIQPDLEHSVGTTKNHKKVWRFI